MKRREFSLSTATAVAASAMTLPLSLSAQAQVRQFAEGKDVAKLKKPVATDADRGSQRHGSTASGRNPATVSRFWSDQD